jgi:short-subunit dehydrogenase
VLHRDESAEISMTKSSALEVAPLGVRVNALCRGLVETRLCSDKTGFITGVALPIDGGYTVP